MDHGFGRLLGLAVVPGVLEWAAKLTGIAVPANLLFFGAAVVLLLVSVQLSYEVGRLDARTRRLAEEVAFLHDHVQDLSQRADGAETREIKLQLIPTRMPDHSGDLRNRRCLWREPVLQQVVNAVASDPQVVEVVVVDNGSDPSPEGLREPAEATLRVVGDGNNLGYTGGANAGAESAEHDVLVFVNSDAIVEPSAATALAAALGDKSVGLVTGLVLLAEDPTVVNAAGNPVHLSLISWAGGFGEPAAEHNTAKCSASISGALFAVRRDDWQRLGGFHELLFAYQEDVDLSLRTWIGGMEVRFVPEARARHFYEFNRNANKWYLLERNRLATLLTVYERDTLLALAPILVLTEAGVWYLALRQGWWRQKAAGYRWLWQQRSALRERRAVVQGSRTVYDTVLMHRLCATIQPSPGFGLTVPATVNRLMRALAPSSARG